MSGHLYLSTTELVVGVVVDGQTRRVASPTDHALSRLQPFLITAEDEFGFSYNDDIVVHPDLVLVLCSS